MKKNQLLLVLFYIIICLPAKTQAYNPAAVGGNITMSSVLYNDLKTIYGEAVVESGMKVELWSVSYYKKTDNSSEKLINFNKKINSSFNYSSEAKSNDRVIKYTFKGNIPTAEGLAVLIYFNEIPSKYKEINISKELPKIETGNLVKYSSNAKQKAGIANKNWGLFCLGKYTVEGGDEVNCNFSLQGFTDKEQRTLGFSFDDIVDVGSDIINGATGFVKDNINMVFEGGKILAGIVINAGGSVVIVVAGVAYNLVKYGNIPKFRTMTQEEYDWANQKIFNNTLPSRTSIFITNLCSERDRPSTIPNGLGQIYLNIGPKGYDNPMNWKRNDNELPGQIFIHELTHTWQIEHNSLLKTAAEGAVNQFEYTILDDKSVYAYNCGKSWSDYNFEQQAKITDACYKKIEMGDFNACEINYVEKNIRNKSFSFNHSNLTNRLHALSRNKDNMEVFTIKEDGSICANSFSSFNPNPFWRYTQIAPPGSANKNSKITSISRHNKTMEIFWTTPDGSVKNAYWFDTDSKWNVHQIAPAKSAAIEGGCISVVSRSANTMEVFWVAPNSSIKDAYWYDGQKEWKIYEVAPAGSVGSFGNNLTALSRKPGTMEIFWIGAAGKIMDAYWYEGQTGWKVFELAPIGSASVFGGITAVSRKPETMEIFWVGMDGSIKDAYWYEGQKNWIVYSIAPANSAVVGKTIYSSTGITAVSRKPETMEIFWITPNGSIKDAFWYEGQKNWTVYDLAPANSANLNTNLKAISRDKNTMELWWQGSNGALQDANWYEGQKTFNHFQLFPLIK